MSQQRRLNNSQQKTITQSINNLKSQLQQQRQHRWSQQKVNQELHDFLIQNNLQQYYNQIADCCEGNLQKLMKMNTRCEYERSMKDIKELPLGQQIKLQKAIDKIPKKIVSEKEQFISQTKDCCWICFQLILEGIECYGKTLCSEKCKQSYLREIQIKCKRCGDVKPKYEAINSYGEWYCKKECVYTDEELMILLMRQSQLKM